MAVKTIIAVCEHCGTRTTGLDTPQDHLMNTDTTSLSFLGLPQLMLLFVCYAVRLTGGTVLDFFHHSFITLNL